MSYPAGPQYRRRRLLHKYATISALNEQILHSSNKRYQLAQFETIMTRFCEKEQDLRGLSHRPDKSGSYSDNKTKRTNAVKTKAM